MSAGVLLAVTGIWVIAQVLGGNALGRLGITGDGEPEPGPVDWSQLAWQPGDLRRLPPDNARQRPGLQER